jgi:hypothetical protein
VSLTRSRRPPIRTLTILTLALALAGAAQTARPSPTPVAQAIAYVFGPYAHQALQVARCESRFSIYARNGQYLGLFQMGASERARYGHAWNAWAQAISAYRYFVDSGRDWSPWDPRCRP